MTQVRVRARQAVSADEAIAAAARIHIALPLIAAVLVISSTALVADLLGLPLLLIVAVTLVVAVLGALVERRAVSSICAGIGLLVIRPYAPGERLLLPSPVDGCLIEAEIVRIGLANTTLATSTGLLVAPNTHLLHGRPASKPPASSPCA
jgi:hypothetical protein